MKADVIRIHTLLEGLKQFEIPIYQRKYSWANEDCKKLWDDIIRSGSDDEITHHFCGSIVYIQDDNPVIFNSATIIDGQQRLTTITLLLVGLIRALGHSKLSDGTDTESLIEYFIVNPRQTSEKYYKLVLTETDDDTLKLIVDSLERSDGEKIEFTKKHSRKISNNFNYINSLIDSCDDLNIVWKGLQKIAFVGIGLSRKEDNPQLIFESINSTGRKLNQTDLIRNYLLMGETKDMQELLYNRYWRPMEEEFTKNNIQIDKFIRHYLTIKLGGIPRKDDVYDTFKIFSTIENFQNDTVTLIRDICKYSKYYFAIELGQESDLELYQAFSDIRDLKVEVAYPFLLELYKEFEDNTLADNEFLEVIRLLESYIFRRAICSIPTNSLNKTFATFMKSAKKIGNKKSLFEKIKSHFSQLPSYRRFPDDKEFKEDIKKKDLYNIRNRNYWLRRIENHNRNERVDINEYTIEHILPQGKNLPNEWQEELGKDWKRIQKEYMHTLGNLTLTGYNSQMSNRSFKEKKDMEGGFKNSPLRVNKSLGEVEIWNEDSIIERAEKLSDFAVTVWMSPPIIDEYNLDETEYYNNENSIENFEQLSHENTRELFNLFKSEVIKLDSEIVTLEFQRSYISFKAETNFVDVIPRINHLRLILNISYSNIRDPQKMCRNVSDVGHLGNGDVEVNFSNKKQLKYIIGLVRQSLDQQLGDNDLDLFEES